MILSHLSNVSLKWCIYLPYYFLKWFKQCWAYVLQLNNPDSYHIHNRPLSCVRFEISPNTTSEIALWSMNSDLWRDWFSGTMEPVFWDLPLVHEAVVSKEILSFLYSMHTTSCIVHLCILTYVHHHNMTFVSQCSYIEFSLICHRFIGQTF